MNGSEKQVKWAEEIKAGMMSKVNEIRQQFATEAAKNNVSADNAQYQQVMAIFDRCVANLEAKTDATWWIDNRQQVISRQWVKGMAA